jgi:aspartyl protease family protein
MPTMPVLRRLHSIAVMLLAVATPASAEIVLVGVFPAKAAVIALDGAAPKTVRIGSTLGPLTVLSVERDSATIETAGQRRTLRIGQYSAAPSARSAVVLSADPSGHYFAQGMVNGNAMRFVVDTGATYVVLPAADARRLAIDYRKGQEGRTQTANGPATVWRVKLDSLRLGDIELTAVDAVVIESDLSVALLGMSFLNRVDMRRDGLAMTLTRRF